MEDAHPQHKPVFGYPAAAQTSYTRRGGATYPTEPPFNRNPRRAALLRRATAAFIGAVIIIGTIYLIAWLALRPRIPRISVSSASVSAFNLSSSKLFADWNVTLSVRNPNKKIAVDYRSVVCGVYYGPALLADTTLAPFHQDRRSETSIDAHLAAAGAYVDGRAGSGLSADRSHGNVEFRLTIGALISFRSGGWFRRTHFIRVFCQHLPFEFPSSSNEDSGSVSGAPRECEVYV